MPSFEFPISDGHVIPKIGQGFDLLAGIPLDAWALNAPPQLETTLMKAGDSLTNVVSDTNSFTKTASRHLELSGSGWGASVGMSLSGSSFSASSATCVSVNFDAFDAISQVLIDQGAQLSPEAEALLQKDRGVEFFEKYGNYFVAGYVDGKRCSMSYRAEFSSVEEQSKFATALSATYKGAAFSTDVEATIENAQTSSNVHSAVSIDFHKAGFDTTDPLKLADLKKVVTDYAAAKSTNIHMKIIVMPWHYLSRVEQSVGFHQNDSFNSIIDLVTGLGYIIRSCTSFVSGGLYSGTSQLEAVQAVRLAAQGELDAINAFLTKINSTNTPATAEDVAGFKPIEPLIDRMNSALRRFILTFKVHIANGDDDCNCFFKDVAGADFVLGPDRVFDGSNGMYRDWGLGESPVTDGKDIGSYAIARPIKDHGVLSADVIALLDRNAGTLQLQVNRPSPDQPPKSPAVRIRGSANGLACDDPNNLSAIYKWDAGNGLEVSASVK